MSVPFSVPAPSAARQPFQNFSPKAVQLPTVGLGKDVMVYVCDDQEELRRLGPRRAVDERKAPALGGPRGDDYGQTGAERTQVSGSD